jgi:hypothetical protein
MIQFTRKKKDLNIYQKRLIQLLIDKNNAHIRDVKKNIQTQYFTTFIMQQICISVDNASSVMFKCKKIEVKNI